MNQKTVEKPRTKVKSKTQRPPLWKVILLNDDYTPREFVVLVLKAVFRMRHQIWVFAAAMLALICAGLQSEARAQVFDFGQIEEFESLGSGTQKGGSPPKTIIDDGARHTVMFTILESNTEAKIHWKSKDGSQTTIM